MTDTTTESLPAPMPLEDLQAALANARTAAQEAQRQVQDWRRKYNAVQEGLQEGLDGLDDEDHAESVLEFLNAHTGWEFRLEKEFVVEVTVKVRVSARNDTAAEEMVENAEWAIGTRCHSDDFDIEDISVRNVREG